MEIYLVRHGIAEDESESGTDAARRLTPEGQRKTARVASALREQVKALDLILHSPFVRAVETAEIFSSEYPGVPLRRMPWIRPEDPPAQFFALLGEYQGLARLMVVGHGPHLSGLASLLLTGADNPILGFKKAGVAGIEWTKAAGGKLMFLLMPKFL